MTKIASHLGSNQIITFRMDTDELSLVEDEYDDGVVCFGPVTESQLNRFKRLPRRTVLPSDFVLR